MSGRKIVIPEGMMKAVSSAFGQRWGKRCLDPGSTVEVALQAALLWLSENPIIPTEEQISIITSPHAYKPEGLSQMEICAAWQRVMFFETYENPVVKDIKRRLRGVTLSPQEADEIVNELWFVAHGWASKR